MLLGRKSTTNKSSTYVLLCLIPHESPPADNIQRDAVTDRNIDADTEIHRYTYMDTQKCIFVETGKQAQILRHRY